MPGNRFLRIIIAGDDSLIAELIQSHLPCFPQIQGIDLVSNNEILLYNTTLPAKENVKDILLVKNSNEIYVLHPDQIIYIEKELRKTNIHTEGGKYITSETLNSLEKRLGVNFFRCHKSFIVNITKIEKIVPIAERIYQLSFYNYPLTASMGRSKLEELCELISCR